MRKLKELVVPEGQKWCPDCARLLPVEEFGKNKSTRDGLKRICRDCASVEAAKWRAKHPEKHKARCAKWNTEHPEERKARAAKWRAKHPEKAKVRDPVRVKAQNAKRRALKRGALPPWYTEAEMNAQIASLCAEAKRLEAETGIPHDLDHIIALCAFGWHASFNMRVIPAAENRSKNAQDKQAKKAATQAYSSTYLATPPSRLLHDNPLPGPYDPEAYLADDGASAEAFILDHGMSWLVEVLRALPEEQLAGLMSVLSLCPYLPEELTGADPEELLTAFETEVRANDLRIQQLLGLITQLATNDNHELPMAA